MAGATADCSRDGPVLLQLDTRSNCRSASLRSSDFYQRLMDVCLDQDPQVQEEFRKYVMGDRSEAYFNMLLAHPGDVLKILGHHPKIGTGFFLMLSGANGLKMIKILTKLYKDYGDHDCLYTPDIHHALETGVAEESSEVMMRFVEVVANISVSSRGFKFIESNSEESLLNKILKIYDTEDLLLKMNIVQVVSVLGEGAESSKLLYESGAHPTSPNYQTNALYNNGKSLLDP